MIHRQVHLTVQRSFRDTIHRTAANHRLACCLLVFGTFTCADGKVCDRLMTGPLQLLCAALFFYYFASLTYCMRLFFGFFAMADLGLLLSTGSWFFMLLQQSWPTFHNLFICCLLSDGFLTLRSLCRPITFLRPEACWVPATSPLIRLCKVDFGTDQALANCRKPTVPL